MVCDVYILDQLGIPLVKLRITCVIIKNNFEYSYVLNVKTKHGLHMIFVELKETVLKKSIEGFPEKDIVFLCIEVCYVFLMLMT